MLFAIKGVDFPNHAYLGLAEIKNFYLVYLEKYFG